jgi:hypothetical protein
LVHGFTVTTVGHHHSNNNNNSIAQTSNFQMVASSSSTGDSKSSSDTDDEETFHDDYYYYGDDMDTKGLVLDDLHWRVVKLRLEEQNTRRFLQSTPRFLPYEECRKWVQAWGKRWESEQDWIEWIAMGEKRNPYIPSAPDRYYGKLGQWKGWDHFLGIDQVIKKKKNHEKNNREDLDGDNELV